MIALNVLWLKNCVQLFVSAVAVLSLVLHSNAIACVCRQPIMVATASTEHSYWLALAFLAVFVYARNASDCVSMETGLHSLTVAQPMYNCRPLDLSEWLEFNVPLDT